MTIQISPSPRFQNSTMNFGMVNCAKDERCTCTHKCVSRLTINALPSGDGIDGRENQTEYFASR